MAITREQDLGQLLERFYGDLRRLARSRIKRLPPSHTLQTTGLIHDAYLRLARKSKESWSSHQHFFGDMAQAMRDILVEYTRRKQAKKRGGHMKQVDPGITLPAGDGKALSAEQTLTLLLALEKIQKRFPQAAEIVFLRYFGGLTMDEIAGVLSVSTKTVERRWKLARTLLHKEMTAS